MKAIKTEEWIPANGLVLEEMAFKVSTESVNRLVVAGPGAGKTELLAQKACFLLQTNTCKYPAKILAISFKRDAAFNLKERVKKRCGEELSKRFESLTFDSFAKQIVDRFGQALPKDYRISANYEIIFNDATILEYYQAADLSYYNTTDRNEMLNFHLSETLPLEKDTAHERLRFKVWKSMLSGNNAKLSFKMIMRLAEFIIERNPKLKKYLQQTYSHVFLDEFQDATVLQYSFFKTCFLNSGSTFTAVGDDKQRIMLWAGAQPTIFENFLDETNAERVPLLMNFRCAPRLVSLLNHLTEHLLGKQDLAIASPKWEADQGICEVWVMENPDAEMNILYNRVWNWIIVDGINPRDICLLVKQQLNVYTGALINYFNGKGIKARDENKYQELLTQEICLYIIHTLYTIYEDKTGAYKALVLGFLNNLHTESDDRHLLLMEISLSKFLKRIRSTYSHLNLDEEKINVIIDEIIDYADPNRIRSFYQNYRNLNFLNACIAEVKTEICRSYEATGEIVKALDMVIGKDTIPVMTIHKSKGLEYHSVVFIGLEDNAFWSFQTQSDEDKCTFFVALSRAKERVIFTFCRYRNDRFGRSRQQSTESIGVILEELENSGIVDVYEMENGTEN